MNLPAVCNGVDPCTDQACQRAIAEAHVISEQEFLSRILPEAGEPRVISAGEMQGILNEGTCGADVIIFDQNVVTNAELNPMPAPEAGSNVAYSYPLYKGILADNPQSFNYYLATGSRGRDVIFKVDFGEAQPAGYYDASNEYP